MFAHLNRNFPALQHLFFVREIAVLVLQEDTKPGTSIHGGHFHLVRQTEQNWLTICLHFRTGSCSVCFDSQHVEMRIRIWICFYLSLLLLWIEKEIKIQSNMGRNGKFSRGGHQRGPKGRVYAPRGMRSRRRGLPFSWVRKFLIFEPLQTRFQTTFHRFFPFPWKSRGGKKIF